MSFKSIEWLPEGKLRLLDQRILPHEVIYNDYDNYKDVAEAIYTMVVRGAPAIGATAAYGMVLAVFGHEDESVDALKERLSEADAVLRKSRPTAVNLFWALNRFQREISDREFTDSAALIDAALVLANEIAESDVAINRNIGLNALPLIPQDATIIHHCNTGSLATVNYGTALGVIRAGHENGRNVSVLVDETRPRLQGARLTSWELQQDGIPHKVIVDGASGHYMRTQGVDFCVVGCDRVAANGDTANKIGTYNLAVVAHENNVPFYVAGPTSTIDMNTPTGDDIEIEERSPEEVTHFRSEQMTPDNVQVGNPAFDVTPAKYITAIITEKGVVYPPYEENLRKLFE